MKNKFLLICLGLFACLQAGYTQSLDSLLRRAYDQNPELKALRLEYEAVLQKAPQTGQLPDPSIGVGIPVLRPETRLGAQTLNISLVQMFPWFGTLSTKQDIILSMAKAKYERVAAARLDIDFRIKSAYLQLYWQQIKQDILKENIHLFESMEQVAMAGVESGKAIASDVLSIRIRLEELTNQIRDIEEEKTVYQATLHQAIQDTSYTPIVVDTSLTAPAAINYDLEVFQQKIESGHPLIKQLDWNIETSEKELAFNTKQGQPSIGVGLDYGLVKARTDANPEHNGRDILVPKFMIAVPIYRKSYDAKKQEEYLKQQAYAFQKEDLTSRIMMNIREYISGYERAKLAFELSDKQIQLAQAAYDILLSAYSSKGERFDELLKLQNDLNRYEVERTQAMIQTHLAKYKIEHLTDF